MTSTTMHLVLAQRCTLCFLVLCQFDKRQNNFRRGNLNWENIYTRLPLEKLVHFLDWEGPADCAQYHSWADSTGCYKKVG